jgi:DNA helicase-2/ATP-dependent DNA helicase PcrA
MDDLSLDLNPAQRAAVEHGAGPALVIAGAGSGKTRVLTARIARLLRQGVPSGAVLAFTFTNRAAREMRARIEALVGEAAKGLWMGTFHATGVRILRREAAAIGRPRDFAIFDREDQESVVRDLIRRMELPDAAFRVGMVIGRISDAKNALVPPEEVERLAISPHEKRIAELYAGYQRALAAHGALDFDDLIGEVVRLFRDHPDIAGRWSRRFAHVLVDEYQDTNHAQFRLVCALAGGAHAADGSRGPADLFVVGDDDQSIYGWRGADLSNVLEFEQAFPGAAVIRLEQNYRSTGNILDAANAVIANNRARKGKTLWCEREAGAKLRFVLAADETDEARRIASFLEEHTRRGGRCEDIAVLYRTNAQSRALETELHQRRIPYQIVGGVSFYQRREVKDILAWLRVVANPRDAVSFWRIWNTPRRGLGPAVRAQVEAAMAEGGDAPGALRSLLNAGTLARGARTGAIALLGLLDELGALREGPPDALMKLLLERSGYLESLDDEDGPAEDRRANVEELVAAAMGFAHSAGGGLADFLAEAALFTDADRLEEGADRVLLLTAHNAKGLEFPIVVVAGLEEGLFPHAISSEEASELEEERRLFYVAITRARDRVLLTAAAYRRRFDAPRGGQISRFVDEIPAALLEREVAPMGSRERHVADRPRWGHDGGGGAAVAVRARKRGVGREVFHERFGRGVVVDIEGEGEDVKCTVRFGSGTRKVLARFLNGGSDDPA